MSKSSIKFCLASRHPFRYWAETAIYRTRVKSVIKHFCQWLIEEKELLKRNQTSPYVFTSQRNQRLTEDGIHHWFRTLKQQANHEEWELIADLSFHDLRHDFAHRARDAGWTLEEVAYYLGHVTMKGTPASDNGSIYSGESCSGKRKASAAQRIAEDSVGF